MFVQTTTSTRKNGKTYVSFLVREAFRTPSGPRSRTVCNITDLPAPTRDLIAASLKGQDFLPADQVQLHEALDYGGLAVLNDAWSRFHLDELFADLGRSAMSIRFRLRSSGTSAMAKTRSDGRSSLSR